MNQEIKNNMEEMTIEVIECGNKLYYDINPESKMDVPSMFYVKLESKWYEWKHSGSELNFYDFCKSQLNGRT